MIKICHMTSAHNSTDTRIFEKECTSLAKLNQIKVYLVAEGESYEKNNVEVVGVGDKPRNRFKRMLLFSKKIYNRALKLDADIYHMHDPELLSYGKKLIKKGKIVIFDSHEDTAESIAEKSYIPSFCRPFVKELYIKKQTRIVGNLSAVISVTPHLVEKFEKVSKNVCMITNYPIILDSSINGTETKKHTGTKIIFAGGVGEQWSHEYIISAINMLDNDIEVEYHIYGKASEEYLSKISKIFGWKKVEYHGVVPYAEIQEELQNADIGVSIAKYNRNAGGKLGTLGNTKIFEEMYAGLPIIATDFVLWKEIVQNEGCGICVNPSDVNEIRDAIKALAKNPKEAKKMGENGRRAVIEKYNWKNEESKLYKLYDNLIKNRD